MNSIKSFLPLETARSHSAIHFHSFAARKLFLLRQLFIVTTQLNFVSIAFVMQVHAIMKFPNLANQSTRETTSTASSFEEIGEASFEFL